LAVTREQFEQGMTYDAYKAQMTRNQERFEENEKKLKIEPADLEAFKKLPKTLKVLVIAEDWCGDVIANVPIVGRLAKESGKLDVRVVLRDQSNLIDSYLNKGEFKSIPVVVIMDENFKELGVFYERPESVTAKRAEQRKQIFTQNPDLGSPDAPADQMSEEARAKYQKLAQAGRDETFDWANNEVIRELRQIAGKAA
jgi:hypothetical protein